MMLRSTTQIILLTTGLLLLAPQAYANNFISCKGLPSTLGQNLAYSSFWNKEFNGTEIVLQNNYNKNVYYHIDQKVGYANGILKAGASRSVYIRQDNPAKSIRCEKSDGSSTDASQSASKKPFVGTVQVPAMNGSRLGASQRRYSVGCSKETILGVVDGIVRGSENVISRHTQKSFSASGHLGALEIQKGTLTSVTQFMKQAQRHCRINLKREIRISEIAARYTSNKVSEMRAMISRSQRLNNRSSQALGNIAAQILAVIAEGARGYSEAAARYQNSNTYRQSQSATQRSVSSGRRISGGGGYQCHVSPPYVCSVD